MLVFGGIGRRDRLKIYSLWGKGSIPLTSIVNLIFWEMAELVIAVDCKSLYFYIVGSNPTLLKAFIKFNLIFLGDG